MSSYRRNKETYRASEARPDNPLDAPGASPYIRKVDRASKWAKTHFFLSPVTVETYEQRSDFRFGLFRTREGHQARSPHRGRAKCPPFRVEKSHRPRAGPAYRHRCEERRN